MTEKDAIDQPGTLLVGTGENARQIGFRSRPGAEPTLVWLGGYRSDMRGTKAEHLAATAADAGLGFCRLDYSGHGISGGRFEDGTISRWTEEAAAVIAHAVSGRMILVASSMGAWIALRLVQRAAEFALSGRIAGLLLLAPAPDFTHRLMKPQMSEEHFRALRTDGFFTEPSEYGPEPNIYTRALFDDGDANLVMEDLIETHCPVTIIQGMSDPDVPYQHALELVSHLPFHGVVTTLVRDGDHRLSRPQDLALIRRAVLDLADSIAKEG
ncbi:alpha/beta hydrolase [Jiella sp. M17.18]|uniref:alpha/beta hydrolase n=1 Tax=Jiella sp. M17.18 TaxID=3234247 RepID=UPI0034DF3780